MEEISSQKLRGGYYTPEPIAQFLAAWAIRSPNAEVLEPSFGDGILLKAATEVLVSLGASPLQISAQLHGAEIERSEAYKAIQRIADANYGCPPHHIFIGDFFTYAEDILFEKSVLNDKISPRLTFSAVIGNPPFIRFQNFPEKHRAIAVNMMERAGFKPSRLMNAWLPFLVMSSLLLNDEGRLAMVIPAELFQVNYAAEVRQFLSDFFSSIEIVTFDQLVFPDIQQEIVLLLAEKGCEARGIRVVEISNVDELKGLDLEFLYSAELKQMNHSTEKWTQYFLTQSEITLLRTMLERSEVTISGQILDVDVGVVTGQNQFFILTQQQARDYDLEPHLQPIVSRSAHLQGALFTANDWLENTANNYSGFIFMPPKQPINELSLQVQNYIRIGEQNNYHMGYKCRIRPLWYVVPSVWTPDAFMLRQVHGYPKLILNKAATTCTDTIHRVRFINAVKPEVAVCAFLNSMTFAFAEVTGRSYGGGVLTFEPSEAERLPMPLIGAEHLDIQQIDILLRKNDIEAVLDITDRVLLVDGLGLSENEAQALRTIWRKLRNRRINRKHSKV